MFHLMTMMILCSFSACLRLRCSVFFFIIINMPSTSQSDEVKRAEKTSHSKEMAKNGEKSSS